MHIRWCSAARYLVPCKHLKLQWGQRLVKPWESAVSASPCGFAECRASFVWIEGEGCKQ